MVQNVSSHLLLHLLPRNRCASRSIQLGGSSDGPLDPARWTVLEPLDGNLLRLFLTLVSPITGL